ncbi:uncharacterized protein LOC124538690 [Vanessa cardui]|uniref:uncharacterized protein LOC124538690 n=1 Tax=Vanessa cardui TaxID=171605 RepID=UPI001F12BAF0|nr:uncharacterized protein LOC124538690 [Vanessa cardui]
MYFLCNICIVLSLLNVEISALTNHPSYEDSPSIREKFAKYYCYKLRTCTPGGDKVCGFDNMQTFLAEFEDLCTLYKINCEKRGMFRPIEAQICDGQKKYLSQPRDTIL